MRWLCVTSLKCQCVALGWPRERRVLCALLVCTQGRRARLPVEFGVINVWIRLNRCRIRVFGMVLIGIRLASACGAVEAFPASPPKKGRGGVGGLWPSMVAMVPPPPLANGFAHKKP